MSESKTFVVLDLSWLPMEAPLCLPRSRAFGATGYRDAAGVDGLFSVYVVLDEEPSAGRSQRARVFALVDPMETELPAVGERFTITSGVTPVAQGRVIERGRGVMSAE